MSDAGGGSGQLGDARPDARGIGRVRRQAEILVVCGRGLVASLEALEADGEGHVERRVRWIECDRLSVFLDRGGLVSLFVQREPEVERRRVVVWTERLRPPVLVDGFVEATQQRER